MAGKRRTRRIEILSRREIADASDLAEKTVEVPEWGAGKGLRIRALTKQQEHDVRARSWVDGVLDPSLFELNVFIEGVVEPELSADDLQWLTEKKARAVSRVCRRSSLFPASRTAASAGG
jgi:hypothetical protein